MVGGFGDHQIDAAFQAARSRENVGYRAGISGHPMSGPAAKLNSDTAWKRLFATFATICHSQFAKRSA